jgi:hypothetical protein
MSDRPEKLGRALGRALRELNMDQRVKESRAMALWPDVVGEVTAARTRPLHVNRGTMVVAVASSAWANQLNLLKGRYLEALAGRVGPGVIQDLRWRVADLAAGPEAGGDGAGLVDVKLTARDQRPQPTLDEAEQAAIARQVAQIEDPKLAARMNKVLTSQAARRQRLKELGWIACQRCGVLHDAADRPYMRARPDAETSDGRPVPEGAQGAPKAVDPIGVARMCPPCRLQVGQLLDG